MCHFWAQNDPFVIKIFFLCTNHYYYFIYLLALFTVQNLKKKYSKSRVMRMHQFCAPNGSLAPNKNLFLKKNINIIFIYLLAPFILQNFKKILKANPDLWGCSTFRPKIPQFVLNKTFWYKPLLLLSSTYWPFSLGKILKNFLQRIQSYEDAPFLGPKWFICSKQLFLENY